ncbi:MAG TPA: hypothetical protein VEX86_16770 [Longimicrobium sp.]|nr:hypothetical protein [Longimicrobium sp.]
MPFDLKLTFTGMMLYVPEINQLQVLMPKTAETIPAPVVSSNGGCSGENPECVEPHAARLTFDTAHTRQGMTALDDVVAHVSLRQKRLDVPAVGSAYVRGVPSDIALATSPVRQDVLDGIANSDLASRIRVSTGAATYADPGECWEYQGIVRRMSHQVEWTIAGVPGDHLDLPLTDLSGLTGQGSLPRLYPINGQIELWVWHAPAFELPPDGIAPETPVDGDQAHHFSHLGILLDSRALEMPLFRPNLCGELPPGTRPRYRDKGATSLNCTGTQAPVIP